MFDTSSSCVLKRAFFSFWTVTTTAFHDLGVFESEIRIRYLWHFIFILTSSVSNGLLHTFPGSVQRFLSAIRFRYRIVPHGSKHSSPDNITGIFRVLCGVRPVYFSVSGQVFARNEDIVYSTCFLWFAVYAESLIWRLASPFQRAPPTMAMKLLQSPFPASAPCTFRFFCSGWRDYQQTRVIREQELSLQAFCIAFSGVSDLFFLPTYVLPSLVKVVLESVEICTVPFSSGVQV